jgi:hypothetical protein
MMLPNNLMLEQHRITGKHDIFIDRDRTSFAYAQSIEKPYGSLDLVLEWCKSELRHDWRWQMIEMAGTERPGRYIFYFDSDKDCMAFSLKWC